MQSRFTAIAAKPNRAFSLPGFLRLRRDLASTSAGPTAKPQESPNLTDEQEPTKPRREDSSKEPENQPLAPPKIPHTSSPRLESTPVSQPSKPMTQQKRTRVSVAGEVSCVGEIGNPWPEEEDGKKTEEEDDREYYKHHKASPLSEVEFADTRKPLTQAMDGTAESGYYGGGGDGVVWLPEQLETAEDALRRATEIWRRNAVRGDPDSPHGRILRTLRGEWF